MAENMVRKRIFNVMKKEVESTFGNLNSALFVTLLPLVMTAQGLVYIYIALRFAGEKALMDTVLWTGVEKLQNLMPSIASLQPIEKFQVLFFYQFAFYLLIVPVMIAMSFASFSIIEEKQTKTIEPLLATPVRTWELLFGKAVAGAIPAVLMTWLCAFVVALAAVWMGFPGILRYILTPSWFVSIFLLAPVITILSFMLGVISSSRAKDAKGAQNISVVLILPVMGIIAVQLVGVIAFTLPMLLALAAGLIVVGYFLLKAAVALFQRESVVVKWK